MNRIYTIAAIVFAIGCGNAPGDSQTAEPDGNGTNQPVDTTGTTPDDDAGGEPDVEPDAGGSDDGDDGGTTTDSVRLTDFHEEVFVAEGCTAGYCHGNFGLGSPQQVIDAFVDVEANSPLCGRTHFVVPGDPEASILWVRVRPKVAEDDECGVTKMPANSETGLDEQSAQMIYDWIKDGAQL